MEKRGKMRVVVLRYGHRDVRDFRVTAHCSLVARAFGAERIIIEGRAEEIKKSADDVTARWGGDFEVGFTDSWKDAFREYKKRGFRTVHLTMYGLPLGEKMGELRGLDKLLVIIGSQKVVREVYELSDHNIAVGDQPHSEIAALAVFLHELFGGGELEREFKGANARVVPQERGKKVVKSE